MARAKKAATKAASTKKQESDAGYTLKNQSKKAFKLFGLDFMPGGEIKVNAQQLNIVKTSHPYSMYMKTGQIIQL